MATTGFWPVKGSLKKVIDYADNPEKTSLSNVLEYASNKYKTDKQLFVSGINCNAENAYEMMMKQKDSLESLAVMLLITDSKAFRQEKSHLKKHIR